jgi:hypothetical protein
MVSHPIQSWRDDDFYDRSFRRAGSDRVFGKKLISRYLELIERAVEA